MKLLESSKKLKYVEYKVLEIQTMCWHLWPLGFEGVENFEIIKIIEIIEIIEIVEIIKIVEMFIISHDALALVTGCGRWASTELQIPSTNNISGDPGFYP